MSLHSTAYACITGLLFIVCGNISLLNAQPVISANNLALGGGGVSYLNNYEASFYNPANLVIYDREGRLHLGAGNAGGYFQPVLSTDNIQNQALDFRDIFLPHTMGSQSISIADRNLILERHYPRSSTRTSQHQARADLIIAGIQWQGNRQAYSLVARTRIGTRTEVGRGWYSGDYIENGDEFIRDFHLTMQSQVLHELSFGYAQEFELINGLIPRINKLYIGIAPKFVLGGAYMDATYNGRYEIQNDMSSSIYVNRFTHHSSGSYSDMIKQYRTTDDLQSSINQHMDDRFFLSPTGYGLGIDFGLTYLISLGSDVAILDEGSTRRPVKKSIRIALSVTDLGIMNYDSSPLSVATDPDTTLIGNQEPVNSTFIGSPGQFSAYFEEAESLSNPLINAGEVSEDGFTSLLPTSINAGAMLDLNRLRLMSDLTLALNKTAFAGTQLTAHLGVEARPVSFIPIRFGTRFAAGIPVVLGMGTGIETRHWNFSVSSQVLLKATSLTSEMVGGAVAGLQFHL